MTLHIGQVIRERYRIESLLGQGGMGAVYCATDQAFAAHVALKENQVITPESQRQFQREASLLYHMRHPHLPRVIDYFAIPEQGQYLVMDYVEGEDLKQLLARRGAVPEPEALAWIGQVLDALDYLHKHKIIHRDVKPANVKITGEGQVFLVDFGLAKVHNPAEETTVGARGVTPGYAPAEQYGAGRTDERTDVYSTGATLYALLSGAPPPDALDLVVGRARLVPLRELRPGISPHVERAVQRAMQTRPDDRFPSVAAFRQALEPEPAMAAAPPAPVPGFEPGQRATRLRAEVPARTAAQELPAPPLAAAAGAPAPQEAAAPPRAVASNSTGPAMSGQRTLSTPPGVWQRLAARPERVLLSAIGVVAACLVVAFLSLGGQRSAPTEPATGSGASSAGVAVEVRHDIFFTSDRDGKPEVYRLRDTAIDRMTHTPGSAGSWDPVWTTGGLYFTSDRDGKPEVYRLHNGQADRMTHTPGSATSWGPSAGEQGILFTSDRAGKPEVYRLHEGVVDRMTHTPGSGGSWGATWTVGGLYFTSDRDGKPEVYRLHDGQTDRMTHTPGSATSWGPSAGEQGILFTSDRDGKPEVYRLYDGTVERMTETPGRAASWGATWTAAGELFTSDRDGKPEVYRLYDGQIERLTRTPGAGASWLPPHE
ncbi:MAG TPA: protein kinase [Anaerolineae bacterium]|nr:protein kinase [Anaerolineae bacterium]